MRREPGDITDAEPAPETYLAELGAAGDGPHDIAMAALMLAALDHRETNLKPFRAHLAELGEAARTAAGFVLDPESAAKALAHVLCSRYGYDGDRMQYDDPLNADMIAVIERRRGLPVALGILYMHAARAAGMEAFGLFAPGHFLLKLACKGEEIVIDPFNGVPFEHEALAGPFAGAPQFGLEAIDHPDEPGPFSSGQRYRGSFAAFEQPQKPGAQCAGSCARHRNFTAHDADWAAAARVVAGTR